MDFEAAGLAYDSSLESFVSFTQAVFGQGCVVEEQDVEHSIQGSRSAALWIFLLIQSGGLQRTESDHLVHLRIPSDHLAVEDHIPDTVRKCILEVAGESRIGVL